ncbi:hypothetical protein [Methylomarinum vadi]|uniref:hypothetical protein n=1 Tax=Methylomarinum vadi TaxID=438855 RepID=UPI0004DF58A1|nr:hypothetical protein [Methylomarinum vadi]
MNNLAIARMTFIEMLNEEFLSNTGYGAYAYLSTCDGVNLFERFIEQSEPADVFIKAFFKRYYG